MEQIVKFGAKVDVRLGGELHKDCLIMSYPGSPSHWLVLFPKDNKPTGVSLNTWGDVKQPWLKEFSKDYYFCIFSKGMDISRVRNFKLRSGYVEYDPEEMLLKEKVTIRFRGNDYEVIARDGVSAGAFISKDSLSDGVELFFVDSTDSIRVSEANYALFEGGSGLHLTKVFISPEFFSTKPNTPYAERRKVMKNNSAFTFGFIFGEEIQRVGQSCMDCVKVNFRKPVDFYVPLLHLEYLGLSETELIQYVEMLNTLDLDLSIDFMNELPKDAMDYFNRGTNCLGTKRFLSNPEITKVRFRMNKPDNAGVNYLRVIFLRYLWSPNYGTVAKNILKEYAKSNDAFYSIVKANKAGNFYHSWNIGRGDDGINPESVDWEKYKANCAIYYNDTSKRGSLGFNSFNSILHSSHSHK